jgi:ribosomal protein L32
VDRSGVLRAISIAIAAAIAVSLLVVAAGQPWFQERCGAAGLSSGGAAVAVAVVALVAGTAAATRGGSRSGEKRRPGLRECPSCGQAVLRDWRMCPYCGASIGAEECGSPNDEEE